MHWYQTGIIYKQQGKLKIETINYPNEYTMGNGWVIR